MMTQDGTRESLLSAAHDSAGESGRLPVPCDSLMEQAPSNNNNVIDDTVSFMPTDIKVMYSNTQNYEPMIDNSRINYVSVKLRCGVVAMCRTNVLTCCQSVLRSINKDILQCLEMMPCSVHSLIRRTKIWINLSYSYGPRDNPRLLRHTTAHHHDAWLLWAHDRPDKMHGIEIYDCRDYQRMRLHWNGAGLLCHELCHLIHQFALQDGLRNATVLHAYLTAKSSGLYDRTLRRDWAGLDCDFDLGYAMVDHKEFWSESSTGYLCDGYQHLDKGDKTMIDGCSPPYLEPNVVERVRQQTLQITLPEAKGSLRGIPKRQITHGKNSQRIQGEKSPALRFLHFLLQFCKPKIDLRKRPLPPCNKFYPFTRGQFREHDIETYQVIRDLWREIELWDDPKDDDGVCGKGFGLFAPCLTQSKFRSG